MKLNWIMVDVESDGPAPGLFSMVSLGAVMVDRDGCKNRFFGQLRPISDRWVPQALAVSGYTREETLKFPDPAQTMSCFKDWLASITGKPVFISDNNGFDWQFINWYFHNFCSANPFGFSSTNLGSLYKGCVKSFFLNFKHLRSTKHTHHPVDDALGNAQAFLKIIDSYNIAT